MTERLYYTDSYLAEFSARITARDESGRRVYLDRSAFYPTSGGQPHDLGELDGIDIVDVIDEGDRVAHVLAAPHAAPDEVHGRIKWARRFDNMQQHTGQHLLSAVLADLFGHATVSVHFGADSSSLDLDVETVPRERLLAAERRANEIIAENRPVSVVFEDAGETTALRKASDRTGTLRIVVIEALDRSACGGTHVRATGEIGAILLRKVDKMRSSARIEFVCGLRAVRRARADFEALGSIAQSLSASIDEAAALVETQARALRDGDNRRRRLETDLAAYRARELWDAATPSATGVRRVTQERGGGKLEDVRDLALAYAALPQAVFVASSAEPPSLLVAASPDSGVDAGRVLKAALATVGGRGGGSPRLAQGSAPDVAALNRVVAELFA